MRSLIRWLILTLSCLGVFGAQAGGREGLDVRLSAASQILRGDVDVMVTVSVTNLTRHTVTLPAWQLPGTEPQNAQFRVLKDGRPVAYTGPLFKRAGPQDSERIRIDPGVTLQFDVELSGIYDIADNGRYDIEFVGQGAHGNDDFALRSGTLYLWLEGRTPVKTQVSSAPQALAGSIGYSGNCKTTQRTQLQSAVAQALTYASAASTYLSGTPGATTRYTTWFGAYTSARWATASTHFAAIRDAFANKPLTLDCSCKKNNVYAYVYPTQPYKIYVCGAFWNAPLTGTDSRAGTLIHEMSHFNVVAGTSDYAYGQSAAKSLAISDPAKALQNADSHEYFAENTPTLQ